LVEPRSAIEYDVPSNETRAWCRLMLSWSMKRSLLDERPISKGAPLSCTRRPSSVP
jgi:hypothetical protein